MPILVEVELGFKLEVLQRESVACVQIIKVVVVLFIVLLIILTVVICGKLIRCIS